MQTRTLSILTVALSLTLLAPSAAAHVEAFSDAKSIQIGPYSVFLDPKPNPLHAGTVLSFTTIITERSTGGYARDITVDLTLTAPNGTSQTKRLNWDDRGYYLGSLFVGARGNHTALIKIEKAGDVVEGTTWLEVYPDLPTRLRPTDAGLDVYVNKPTELGFQVIDARSLQPSAALTDLTIRIEHWSDDHNTLLLANEFPMRQEGTGTWVVEYDFPVAGMAHLSFSSVSGGFTYPDTPLLHMYATKAIDDEPSKETPWPVGAALLVGLIVALARRRS